MGQEHSGVAGGGVLDRGKAGLLNQSVGLHLLPGQVSMSHKHQDSWGRWQSQQRCPGPTELETGER